MIIYYYLLFIYILLLCFLSYNVSKGFKINIISTTFISIHSKYQRKHVFLLYASLNCTSFWLSWWSQYSWLFLTCCIVPLHPCACWSLRAACTPPSRDQWWTGPDVDWRVWNPPPCTCSSSSPGSSRRLEYLCTTVWTMRKRMMRYEPLQQVDHSLKPHHSSSSLRSSCPVAHQSLWMLS